MKCPQNFLLTLLSTGIPGAHHDVLLISIPKFSYISKNETKMSVGATFWFPVYPTIWEAQHHTRLGRGKVDLD